MKQLLRLEIIYSSLAHLQYNVGSICDLHGISLKWLCQMIFKSIYIPSIKVHLRQPLFMEIIILICWSIWTTRNDFIFEGLTPSLYRTRRKLKDELHLLIHKAKRKSYAGLKVVGR
jgi:hypothetical protein